jgi:hypothetical protein
LASGPLSIYKKWHEIFRPNKHWFLRYDQSNKPLLEKEKEAELKVELIRKYLNKSRLRLRIRTGLLVGFTSIAFLLLIAITMFALQQSEHSGSHLKLAMQNEKEANFQKELAKIGLYI